MFVRYLRDMTFHSSNNFNARVVVRYQQDVFLKAYAEISEASQEVHVNRVDYRHLRRPSILLPLKLPQRPCKHIVNLVLVELKRTVLQPSKEFCDDWDLPQ